MFWLGQVSFGSSWVGDIDTAEEYLQKLVDLRSDEEVPALEAVTADARGTIMLQIGDLEPALEMFRLARELYGELGMGPDVEHMLQTEASILIELGRYDEASPLIDQALALARDLKDSLIGARGVMLQGRIATEKGDSEGAWQHLTAGLSMSRSAHDQAGIVWAVLGLATLAHHVAEFEEAAFLHGVAESIRSGLDVELPAVARGRAAAELARAAQHLGEQVADQIWKSGRDAGYDAAIALSDQRSPSMKSAIVWSSSGSSSGGT
jgi:tetratricopeptide (TPR) repeat protein